MKTANLQVTKLELHQAAPETTVNGAFDSFDSAIGSDFIRGLQLSWVSPSSITVGTGMAALPGGGFVKVGVAVTVTSISLGANAWGHVYLYKDVSGNPAVEVVTTAPASYFGTAYQKTGDATRRYLGSVRTDGSGNIHNFLHDPSCGFVRYRTNVAASPFRVLTNGTATAATDVDCSACVPVTARRLEARLTNLSSASAVNFGSSDGIVPSAASGSLIMGTSTAMVGPLPLNPAQLFKYIYDSSPTNGLYVDVLGYWFAR